MPGTQDDSTEPSEVQGLSSPQAFAAHAEEEPAPIAAGDCFGRYTVRAPIGAGAMGEVYAAHDPELDRLIALKVLRLREADTSPRARARFQREAQAMARLNHPNVVAVYDVGAVGDRVFVAMELVEGPTLASWMAERQHPWPEVVARFLEAGRGLAAAHAAGIVHRDFKPANVIVGDRIRVADFGLARAVTSSEESSGPSEVALQGSVTHTGQLLGTPAYMAPEVRAGATPTPQSDQYSFTVALHEALFGFRPEEPADRPAPAVPGWLRAVVERGLRERPAERYPSMAAFVAELGRDRSRLRRRVGAVAGLVLLGAAAWLARPLLAPIPSPCAAAGTPPGFWSEAAQAQVAQAFRATGKPFADVVYQRIDAALRARTAAWARHSREACEAAEIRHELSPGMLDLRRRCLGRARNELEAFVGILEHADAAILARAAQAVAEVGDLEACADDEALAGAAPMPRDPTVAVEGAALQQDLARLLSLRQLGRWDEGIELGRQLIERARRVGHGPVLARALEATGELEALANRAAEEAVALLYEAANVAAVAKDDATVAEAFSDLTFALGTRKQRIEAADVAYRSAVAAAARAGNPGKLLARLASNRASVFNREGNEANALAFRLISMALEARLSGVSSFAFADKLAMVAASMTTLGAARAGWPLHDRAIAITERILGPTHPTLARLLGNAGGAHLDGGDVEGGAALLERALAVKEQAFSPDHLEVAQTAINLAWARLAQRRLDEARALFDRSARIRAAHLGSEHQDVARSREGDAVVLGWQGRPDDAHRELVEVLASFQKAFPGERHIWSAEAYVDDAMALLDSDHPAGARKAGERGLAIYRSTVGEEYPDVGDALAVLGDVDCAEGRCAEAAPLFRRAVDLHEREAGPESTVLVEPLLGLCSALVETDAGAARTVARRALALAARAPADLRARADFCAAEVESDRARARAARDALAAVPHRRHDLARMNAWLAGSRR